jgi:hypothetical protein
MADAATTEAEFWHVQLPSGEVRYWSLEELDEAFQRDEVDAKTYVLKEGESAWQRLGELLGLDEVPSVPSVLAIPAIPAAPLAAGPITYTVPPYSMATPASVRVSEPPSALSIRPVVSDVSDVGELDDDLLVASMKPKRKNLAFFGGGAAAALVLVIVAVAHGSSGGDEKVAAAAPAPPPPAAVDDSDPTVAATNDAPRVLSDDVKRRVLEADKDRAAKAAARAAENARIHGNFSAIRAPKSGAVFHKGGNQFDPLSVGN